MSRVTLLYGEQALVEEYNNHVGAKLNEKSPETKRKSNSSVGFSRGIQQMKEDIDNFNPLNSYLCSPAGGLFDTKKDFYRLISLLLTDLGLVFDIRSPSPWQVISELRNQDIISESDSAILKVCLSIANEIRLKAYFANCGQKELFSPLLPSPDVTRQSTDDPFFRDFDEDTLVRLLSVSFDMRIRCDKFYSKYNDENEMDVSILRDSIFPSMAALKSYFYFRLEKSAKALECLKSIPKDFPDYHQRAFYEGLYRESNGEYKEAIECYETALEYSRNQTSNLWYHSRILHVLNISSQVKKATSKFEEAMKLHDEIYGEGSETIILSKLMKERANIFYVLQDFPSAIKMFQKVEQMQKRMTRRNDLEVISLNLEMALSYSGLCQNDRSFDRALCLHLDRALCLSKKVFGKDNLSNQLPQIYLHVARVYYNCNQYDKAKSWIDKSLKLTQSLHGDTPHLGKIVTIEKKWEYEF